MVVKKSAKKVALHGSGGSGVGSGTGGSGSHDENNSDLAAMRGTLEDYFNSKKAYQTDKMRELNKEVTKHLLTGSGDDNAMVMERHDASGANGVSSTRVEVGEDDDDGANANAVGGRPNHDEKEQDEPRRRTSASESGHDYEDDYESDSSATAASKSVAGMTLGDYLDVKGDGVFPVEAMDAKPESKRAALPPEKLPQKPSATSKKPLPPAVISGMSLDYYLGASSAAAKDGGDDNDDDANYYHHHADSKSPLKRKKLQGTGPVPKSNAKSLLAALPARQPLPPDYTARDEFVTPYQKRMKKQTKLKQQQQQHIQQGGAVAKSILLGDSHSSSQLLLAKHLPTSASSSTSAQSKDKKKHSGATGSQPPLPKLLGASSSTHSFVATAHHRDPQHGDAGDDADVHSGFAGDDSASADEKLPPLQHAGHK